MLAGVPVAAGLALLAEIKVGAGGALVADAANFAAAAVAHDVRVEQLGARLGGALEAGEGTPGAWFFSFYLLCFFGVFVVEREEAAMRAQAAESKL